MMLCGMIGREGRRFLGMMANRSDRKRHYRLPPATIRHPGVLGRRVIFVDSSCAIVKSA
jgi:hypothetical protein